MAMDFPSNPVDGQISGNYIYSASSGAWKGRPQFQATTTQSPTAPTSPNDGDIWINTSDGTSYTYFNDGTSRQWIELVGSGIPATPISVVNGGTGTNTLTSGGYLKGAGTSAITSQSGIPATDITSGTLSLARLSPVNYSTGLGSQITVATTTPTIIASCSITTKGRPVLIIGTGNMNPLDASVWQVLGLYRDSTQVGKIQVIESRGASWNTAFALNHIDVPAAGTYTYSIKAWQGSGSGQYGESAGSDAPEINAIEFF